MNKRNPLLSQKPKHYFWQIARKRSAAQLRAHPLRFGVRIFVIGMFLNAIYGQIATNGHPDILCVGLAALFIALTIARLLSPLSAKGEAVHQWAVEEQEHLTMAALTGKTPEELEKMLEYHMKYGHIEEADRISQKLLTMVDKTGIPEEPPQQHSVAAEQAGNASGLPSWMQDGPTNDTTTTQPADQIIQMQPEKKKLPDWMN